MINTYYALLYNSRSFSDRAKYRLSAELISPGVSFLVVKDTKHNAILFKGIPQLPKEHHIFIPPVGPLYFPRRAANVSSAAAANEAEKRPRTGQRYHSQREKYRSIQRNS